MDPAYDPADPCKGCGVCCSPVQLSTDMVERVFRLTDRDGERSPDIGFLREHLHYLETGGDEYVHFTCDQFIDGRCAAYEKRPEMCSGYPFYNREPASAPLFSTCTFHDQVPGRRVLPLMVL